MIFVIISIKNGKCCFAHIILYVYIIEYLFEKMELFPLDLYDYY